MPLVKLGTSRQVVIPKKLQEELGLQPGDYLEVEIEGERLIFTPKAIVDKHLERRLAQSIKDFKDGRTHGPYKTARTAMRGLRAKAR